MKRYEFSITLDLATSLREIGEFLSTHYPELI